MNTSYTINTALSKGLESITRHHSPLTTEYISFQHIYKSYSEGERKIERKNRGGRLEEEIKQGASTLPESKTLNLFINLFSKKKISMTTRLYNGPILLEMNNLL